MTEKKKKILIIALAVLALLIIVFGFIFNKVQDSKRDWASMNQTEVEEDTQNEFPFENDKIAKEGFGAIGSIVLRNSSDTMSDRYTFEMSTNGEKTYFSCDYYVDGEHVVIANEEINNSRLTEVTNIIDRYTVATTIRNYRKDPKSVELSSDDTQALELTWLDGDFANFGFPNGAGPALKKYFTGLAEWMNGTATEEE